MVHGYSNRDGGGGGEGGSMWIIRKSGGVGNGRTLQHFYTIYCHTLI